MIGYTYWSLYCKLRDFVKTAPKRTKKEKERLLLKIEWLNKYISIIDNHEYLHDNQIPDLYRGDVILVELGENLGKEFSGKHPAIVLRDCPIGVEQVFILPLTSKKPKLYKPNVKNIYMEFKRIKGMKGCQHPTNSSHPDNYKHWCNILNVRNISKSRIVYPPTPCKVDGKYLTAISATIKREIAIK